MGNDGARLKVAGIADPLEFIAQAGPVGADAGQRFVDGHTAGMDQRAHHVRLVTHALFVGEGANGDGTCGQLARLAERPDHGQPGKHPVATIQGAGVGHGIDVGAHHQRSLAAVVGG
ncbi:hypothetical protein D3C84_968630 [compost metagenome]